MEGESTMWLVVGVSGVTCGGKTTLAANLALALPNAVCVNQDKYFLPESSERHTFIPSLRHNNWELLTSLDMDRMLADIRSILASDPGPDRVAVLLVEGHTIFNCPPIAEMCRLKYYLSLTREQCLERRLQRVYDPPDVAGYFEQVVWPEHLRHSSEMRAAVPDVRMMDGTTSQGQLLEVARGEILALAEQCFRKSGD